LERSKPQDLGVAGSTLPLLQFGMEGGVQVCPAPPELGYLAEGPPDHKESFLITKMLPAYLDRGEKANRGRFGCLL